MKLIFILISFGFTLNTFAAGVEGLNGRYVCESKYQSGGTYILVIDTAARTIARSGKDETDMLTVNYIDRTQFLGQSKRDVGVMLLVFIVQYSLHGEELGIELIQTTGGAVLMYTFAPPLTTEEDRNLAQADQVSLDRFEVCTPAVN